ncbi:3-hydroxyacyl-ACP dehydratase FabZ family protein [Streptomyces sp. NPDC053367]|uniref:3-hydroxyacyl-ACP dehydratase FabZ family protein n=1 Tax=Streptomyces sp. NPDC053367 TaxID=3365700 RepID=UPI0037D85F21
MATPVQSVPEVVSAGPAAASTRVPVGPGERVFPGHYPGFPIFPGVCVVEHVHLSALAAPPEPGLRLRLEAIESTRFLSPVFPGDELTVELTWEHKNGRWRCKGVAGTARGRAAAVRLRFDDGSGR